MAATSHDFWLAQSHRRQSGKSLAHVRLRGLRAASCGHVALRHRAGRDAIPGAAAARRRRALVFGLHAIAAARQRRRAITRRIERRLTAGISWTSAMWTTFQERGRGSSPASPASGSPSFAMKDGSRLCRTSVSTRTVPSVKGASSTTASSAPGTGTEYCRNRAHRRRRSPSASDVQRAPGRRPRSRRSPAQSARHAGRIGAHSECNRMTPLHDRDEFFIG